MRIVVNDIAASSGGAMTVLEGFYNFVKKNGGGSEWVFLLNDKYFNETDNIKIICLPEIKRSGLKKLCFDFIAGKRFIAKLKPDAVLSLQNIITFGLRAPQIVYIHQSLPFQQIKNFSFLRKDERISAVYQYLIGAIIKLSAKKAERVAVQTEWMREAVCKKTGISRNKIIKVFPDADDLSGYMKNDGFRKNRFFYPTADSAYKNNGCIYKACRMLKEKRINDFQVVMTLDGNKSYNETENIKCTGKLEKERVFEEYSRSVLVFPSYVETVGLPLIEARRMNTLILASDCPFSREVLAGYGNAYYFDPFKPEELAVLMEMAILDEIEIIPEERVIENGSESSWNILLDELLRHQLNISPFGVATSLRGGAD